MTTTATPTEHVMRTMGAAGDTRLGWDPSDPRSVKEARDQYERLTASRYKAFRMGEGADKRGEPMDRFDPSAREIVLVPQIAGGA